MNATHAGIPPQQVGDRSRDPIPGSQITVESPAPPTCLRVRSATHGSIPHQRWHRASTYRRLSAPHFDAYSFRSSSDAVFRCPTSQPSRRAGCCQYSRAAWRRDFVVLKTPHSHNEAGRRRLGIAYGDVSNHLFTSLTVAAHSAKPPPGQAERPPRHPERSEGSFRSKILRIRSDDGQTAPHPGFSGLGQLRAMTAVDLLPYWGRLVFPVSAPIHDPELGPPAREIAVPCSESSVRLEG